MPDHRCRWREIAGTRRPTARNCALLVALIQKTPS